MYQLVLFSFLSFLLFLSNDICTTAWRCIFDGKCICLRACSTVQPRATWKSRSTRFAHLRDHRVALSLCNSQYDTSPGFNRVSYLNERSRYISSTMSLRIRFLATDACILWNNASGARDKLSFGAFTSRGGIFDTQNGRKRKRHNFCIPLNIFIR